MKKLFTLLLTVGSITSVFAQYNGDNKNGRQGKDENTAYNSKTNNGGYANGSSRPEVSGRNNEGKDYAYNDHRYNESSRMSARERDFQVQKINREYDFKTRSVNANRYLRPREKNFQIRSLEKQRYNEIRNIQDRFSDSRDNDGHPRKW